MMFCKVPPLIFSRKWGAFCQYRGGTGLKLLFTPTLATFASFFAQLRICHYSNLSNDFNFKVPPIWPYNLEQKFKALHETKGSVCQYRGQRGSNSRLSTPTSTTFLSYF